MQRRPHSPKPQLVVKSRSEILKSSKKKSKSKYVRNYAILHNDEEWTYTGEWVKGQPHGVGKVESPAGEYYEGEFVHGSEEERACMYG